MNESPNESPSADEPGAGAAQQPNAGSIGERLGMLPALLSEHLRVRVSARAFALTVGSSAQALHGYRRGTMPPASLIAEIARQYPYVHLRWLLLGEGEPLDEGGDLMTLIVRKGAERGITFERLTLTPQEKGGYSFDAAGTVSP